MAQRRWPLFVLSLGSLVVLTYAAVLLTFSVPVTDAMVEANRLPGAQEPNARERAIVLPLTDPTLVPTFAARGEATLGHPGALLASGDPSASFPASATNVSLGRALAYVSRGADGTYAVSTLNLTDVPVADGNGTSTVNLTIDVPALAGGGTGFIVKGDAEREPRFVPLDEVVGQVARFEARSSIGWLFASGAFGFVAPLVFVVLTHRGAGRKGPAGMAVCRECRRPLAPGADFCSACGAWVREGGR